MVFNYGFEPAFAIHAVVIAGNYCVITKFLERTYEFSVRIASRDITDRKVSSSLNASLMGRLPCSFSSSQSTNFLGLIVCRRKLRMVRSSMDSLFSMDVSETTTSQALFLPTLGKCFSLMLVSNELGYSFSFMLSRISIGDSSPASTINYIS